MLTCVNRRPPPAEGEAMTVDLITSSAGAWSSDHPPPVLGNQRVFACILLFSPPPTSAEPSDSAVLLLHHFSAGYRAKSSLHVSLLILHFAPSEKAGVCMLLYKQPWKSIPPHCMCVGSGPTGSNMMQVCAEILQAVKMLGRWRGPRRELDPEGWRHPRSPSRFGLHTGARLEEQNTDTSSVDTDA